MTNSGRLSNILDPDAGYYLFYSLCEEPLKEHRDRQDLGEKSMSC